MKYKLAAFDLGGVLIYTGEIPSREVWKLYGFDEKTAMGIWRQHDSDFFGGRISERKWWGYFAEKAPVKVPEERVEEVFRNNFQIYGKNLNVASRLRVFGENPPRTAVWTNNSREWLAFQKEKFHIQDNVDAVVSSHELGKTKYEPGYFSAALSECNRMFGTWIKPREVAFFDDDERYCKNAEAAGMDAYHVGSPELFQDAVTKAFNVKV